MPYVLLAIGAAAALLALNAHVPTTRPWLLAPSFFAGWFAIELAPHLLVAEVVAVGLAIARGGLDGWPGWAGLALGAAGAAGTVASMIASRRTVVTLRECGIPMALKPEQAPRFPLSHLVVPPLCLIPRKGVKVQRNVVYHEEGHLRLKLDVYSPSTQSGMGRGTADGLRPGLMQIHGGAWVIGDKREQGLPLVNHMALQGWVAFNVNYRLSPKATWPDHLIDLKRFLRWYREHAAEYGADPDFLCVTGGSAGGHLTAMVALTANVPEFQPGFEDVDTSVQGAVPFYGVYDFVAPGPRSIPMGALRFMQRMVMKKSFSEETSAFAEASPVHHLRQDAPPFLVIHGSHDSLVPVEQARRFVRRLREVSAAPVLYAEMRGGQHGFDVFPSYRTARVVEGVERYLTGLHRRYRGQARPATRPGVPEEATGSLE